MNIDHPADPILAAPMAALRQALDTHTAPPGVEKELMAAFNAHFPRKRWYHALSPRQWGLGVGSSAVVAVMALVLTLQSPSAPIGAVHGPRNIGTVDAIDEGSPFIALESIERIEQEANPHMLEADLPRTALASLGIAVNPENAGDSVRAELLIGADGSPLALRLVSLQ